MKTNTKKVINLQEARRLRQDLTARRDRLEKEAYLNFIAAEFDEQLKKQTIEADYSEQYYEERYNELALSMTLNDHYDKQIEEMGF